MPSIGVLEHFQKPTDKPTRRIKRSGGQSLVRQGKAEWIRENVLLKMIDCGATNNRFSPAAEVDSPRLNANCSRQRSYIPEEMPPNLDGMLGIIVRVPVLPLQIRFRPGLNTYLRGTKCLLSEAPRLSTTARTVVRTAAQPS
jgi:hypothetical protein